MSPNIEPSDVMERTGHPCRLDFERFGAQIGIVRLRLKKVLDKYMQLPNAVNQLVGNIFLNEKMKRTYLRVVNERMARFCRVAI